MEPELYRPRRQHQILRAHRVDHVNRRESFGLQRGNVYVHRDQPLLSAVWIGSSRAGNRRQPVAHEIHGQVVQFLLAKSFSAASPAA